MAASLLDKYQKKGASTVTTLSAPGKAIGAGSITVGSTTNYPIDTGITIAIRVVDTNGDLVAGTYTEWNAIVASGTSFTIDTTPAYGSDQIYAAGSTTQIFIPLSSYSHNKAVDGLLAQHNQDGTHGAITATSATATGTVQGATVVSTGDVQLRSTSLETIRTETCFDHVASGGVWSGDAYASTRNASMTALVCYINGRRGTISAVTARSFTASKDTYVDVLNSSGTFSLVYTEVVNNAASPALAANSIRIAIIVTGATNIAAAGSVNQGEVNKILPIASSTPYTFTDSLGNIICPRDPLRRMIGFRRIVANFVSGVSSTHQQVTGLATPVIVPTGRKTKIHFKAGTGVSSGAVVGSAIGTGIYNGAVPGGTQLSINAMLSTSGSGVTQPGDTHAVEQPVAGLNTYNASIYGTGAAANSVVASSTSPAYLIVELD